MRRHDPGKNDEHHVQHQKFFANSGLADVGHK